MDGLGLDNMLSAEQVEKMFSPQSNQEEDMTSENAGEETPEVQKDNETQEEAAEVDFSDLLGNQPEIVGSEENTEGNRETPASISSGTPQANLFSSIAGILRDKGVFPDLSDDALKTIKDEADLEKLFTDKVNNMLSEEQQRLRNALNSGATNEEMQEYQNAYNILQNLESREARDLIGKEGDDGENFRKRVLYQDYVNRGFKHERAVKMVQKSVEEGNDIEDAKEAFESCKEFYKNQVENFNQVFENRKKEYETNEQKQYSNLKKNILDKETFFDGIKVDRNTRQKAYDSITKPVYKDAEGNQMNALQKYQREHPMEYMENVAMLYALTDGFKNVEKLAKNKVKAGLKKGFAELESVLNSTARNGDGTLNFANTPPDDNRENWTLA